MRRIACWRHGQPSTILNQIVDDITTLQDAELLMSSHKNILSRAGIQTADELLLMSQKEQRGKNRATGTLPKTAKKEDDFKVAFMKGEHGDEAVNILETVTMTNGGAVADNKDNKVWKGLSKGEKFKKLVHDRKNRKKPGDIELDNIDNKLDGNKLHTTKLDTPLPAIPHTVNTAELIDSDSDGAKMLGPVFDPLYTDIKPSRNKTSIENPLYGTIADTNM